MSGVGRPSHGFDPGGPWQAITGYGEPGDLSDLHILPPRKYRGTPGDWREPAGYGVTARGRLWPGRVELDAVTVTDRDTGAALTVRMAGGSISASLPPDLATADLARLWRDGRYLAGWASAQAGRPSELADRIAEIVRTAADIGPAATRQAVAERLGRVDSEQVMHGSYKRDVRDAGGWLAIRRRAREL